MSTVGTVYDETIKNGFAKLLSTQTVTNVTAVDFIAPLAFALGYRTFWIDIDNVKCGSDSDRLVAFVSTDGGASWGTDHLWSFIRVYSHSAGNAYGSVALEPSAAGGFYRGSMWIGDTQLAAGGYMSGRLYFHRLQAGAGGTRALYGDVVMRYSGGLVLNSHAQVPWFGGDFNAIRIKYNAGLLSGTIRLYGLKTGSN